MRSGIPRYGTQKYERNGMQHRTAPEYFTDSLFDQFEELKLDTKGDEQRLKDKIQWGEKRAERARQAYLDAMEFKGKALECREIQVHLDNLIQDEIQQEYLMSGAWNMTGTSSPVSGVAMTWIPSPRGAEAT